MPELYEKYRLDNYIVGESNKYAHSAALAVMESPGDIYNPLLIFGETGTGKTHLLNAIGWFYKEKNLDINLIYLNAEEIIRDIIESIKRNRTNEMREKYNMADVLIVDDIQLIAGKEATQEEILHIFNPAYSDGRQIILSSNMSPRKIEGFDERKISRIMRGLAVEVTLPDMEMRRRFIKRFVVLHDITLDPAVVDSIANKMNSNVFELEGFIKSVMLYAETNHMSTEELMVVDVEKLLCKEQVVKQG